MTSLDSSPPLPQTTNPLDGVPPLTTTTLTTSEDKISALKLVADSIAQQRQFAARAVIFHPLTLSAYILLLGIISQLLYKDRGDIGIVLTTAAGVTMACLVGIRGLTSGYLSLAESFNWDFARNEDGEEDVILGSRYGDELIGALILRLEPHGPAATGKRKSSKSKSGGNGVVRAWTVRNKYRGKGVGTELLEEAVRVSRERLGRDAGVGFAAEHANSKMVVPEIFNGRFRRRERMAGRLLESVVAGVGGNGRGKKR